MTPKKVYTKEGINELLENVTHDISDLEEKVTEYIEINYNDFHMSTFVGTRNFTQEEISFLDISDSKSIRLIGLTFDDTSLPFVSEDNYIIMKKMGKQNGMFGPPETETQVNNLYYIGKSVMLGSFETTAMLIVDKLQNVGTLVFVIELNSMIVNGSNPSISYFIPNTLGSDGQILVSTGQETNPFTYKTFQINYDSNNNITGINYDGTVYTTKKYVHNLCLWKAGTFQCSFTLTNNSPTKYTTVSGLKDELGRLGFTSRDNKYLNADGWIYDGSVQGYLFGIVLDGTSLTVKYRTIELVDGKISSASKNYVFSELYQLEDVVYDA